MIEVKSISKSFAEKQVLENINAVFRDGWQNMIIGRSGSGKTVFLKTIVGLHEPTEGAVYFDGKHFNTMNFKARKEIRKEIGMVFQGGALFTSETVEENVMFPLNMFTKMSLREKKKRVDECLELVNVGDVKAMFPPELSGGMQKRVSIARAIALKPKYLFCDEPNSGLDPVTSLRIDRLIGQITTEFNMTTIINTHDMNSVMEIGDYIIFIHEGKKWWEGDKKTILESDNKELNDFVFASDVFKRAREAKS